MVATLLVVLKQLRQDLGDTAFVVVDHWESDLCAVGVADPRNPRVLAYVSTWSQPEGRYYLVLDSKGRSGLLRGAPDSPERDTARIRVIRVAER